MKISILTISLLTMVSSIFRCGKMLNRSDDAVDAARYSSKTVRGANYSDDVINATIYKNQIYDASKTKNGLKTDYFGIARGSKVINKDIKLSQAIFNDMGNYPKYQLKIERDIYDAYYEIYHFEKNSEINHLIKEFPQHKDALMKIKSTDNVQTKSNDLDRFRVLNNIKSVYFSDERTFHLTKILKKLHEIYDFTSNAYEIANYTESNEHHVPNESYQQIFTFSHPNISQIYISIHSHVFVYDFKNIEDWKKFKINKKENILGRIEILSKNNGLYTYRMESYFKVYYGLLKEIKVENHTKIVELEFYNPSYYNALGLEIISKIE